FGALVERHGPMVMAVCRRGLRDHHDAQDAVQAAFLVLGRKAGSVRGRRPLAGWLLGVGGPGSGQTAGGRARRGGTGGGGGGGGGLGAEPAGARYPGRGRPTAA